MQVAYDNIIYTRIVKLNSKENEPIRLKNVDDDHRRMGPRYWIGRHCMTAVNYNNELRHCK